ncbi:hypothetical protein DdX_08557 [Ditylenchus destructor]|uniref:Uncharacterized protein n=1 Tax=Ditylenchus destructor TaxID=166010 RepID=A0AAD4N1C2_9BILA|nr:hypothetical protein DdX_08557 [Ditylenchus destructor]
MLSYWYLLDILKFVNRNDLERIQVTNRMLNDIVNRDFATYPLRVMPETMAYVQIENNDLVISIQKNDRCFVPLARQWKCCNCRQACKNFYPVSVMRPFGFRMSNKRSKPRAQQCNHCNCKQSYDHFYPVNVMRPFLCKNIRFKFMSISIKNDDDTTANHIATLESISHIWAAKILYIHDREDLISNSWTKNLLLRSSSVLQCRILHTRIDGEEIQILQHANIWSLNAIVFDQSFGENEILQLVEQKAFYPHSDTALEFYSTWVCINIAFEAIKQKFLASDERCRLRLIVRTTFENFFLEFRLQNALTNEVLEVKRISEKEANEFHGTKLDGEALSLERYIA